MACFPQSNSSAWDPAQPPPVSKLTASFTKISTSRKPNVSSTSYDPGNDRIPHELRLPHLGLEDGDYFWGCHECRGPAELGRAEDDGACADAARPYSRRSVWTFAAAGGP